MRTGTRIAAALLVAGLAAADGWAKGREYLPLFEATKVGKKTKLPQGQLLAGAPFAKDTHAVSGALFRRGARLELGGSSVGARGLEVSIYRTRFPDHARMAELELPTEPDGPALYTRKLAAREALLAKSEELRQKLAADPVSLLEPHRRRSADQDQEEWLSWGFDSRRMQVQEGGDAERHQIGWDDARFYVWRNDDPMNPRGYGDDDAAYRAKPWIAFHPAYHMSFQEPATLPGPGSYVVVARTEHGETRTPFLYTDLEVLARRSGDSVRLQAVWRADGRAAGPSKVHAHWVLQGPRPGPARVETVELATDATGALVTTIPAAARAGSWFLVENGEHKADLAGAGTQGREVRDGNLAVHFTTDRQVYKPGDTVEFRGVARRIKHGQALEVLGDQEIKVMLGWNDEAAVRLRSDEFGAFAGKLPLDKDLHTGQHQFQVQIEGAGTSYVHSVEVLAYRKPEHEVLASVRRPWYVAGETAVFPVHGRFTVGGNLAGEKIRWEARETGAAATAHGKAVLDFDGGGFDWGFGGAGGGGGGHHHGHFDEGGLVEEWIGPDGGDEGPDGPAQTAGEAVLDDEGRYEIPVPVKVAGQDRGLAIDVILTSPDGREVRAAASTYAARSKALLGLKTTQSLVEEGEAWVVLARTRDLDGKPLAREVALTLQRRLWVQDAKGGWKEKIEVLRTFTEKVPASGEAQWRIEIPKAGTIELLGKVVDDEGRAGGSRIGTFRAGEDAGWWRWDRIDLKADRASYAPGETARILIQCPVEKGTAWWTLEGNSLRTAGAVPVAGYNAVLELPIDAADRPLAQLRVVTMKDGSPKEGTLELKVPAAEKQATLRVETDARVYEPGSTVKVALAAAGADGKPLEGVLCLAVVDEALEQVAPDRTRDPYEVFYGSRRNLVESYGYSRVRTQAETNRMAMSRAKNGGGFAKAMAMADGAPMAEAASLDMEAGAAAPGGGGGGGDGIRVRSTFRDVAHWVGSVRTDATGKAALAFTLPDDLSRWKLVGYFVDRESRVAKGEARIVARRDLMVRLGLPRFLVQGDHLVVKSSVQNLTDKEEAGSLDFKTLGSDPVPLGEKDLALLRIRRPSPGAWLEADGTPVQKAPDRYALAIPAQGNKAVDFPIFVFDYPARGSMTFESKFAAAKGGGDALARVVPVLPFGRRETEVVVAEVKDKARVEIEARPGTVADATHASLDLMLGLAQGVENTLVADLEALIAYEYGCTEQTLSRFIPLATVRAALGPEWLARAGIRADLDAILDAGIERLRSLRVGEGWGWGPGSEASSSTTAYLVSRVYRMPDPYRQKLIDALELERAVEWLAGLWERNATEALDREERDRQDYRLMAVYRCFEALAVAGRVDTVPRLPKLGGLEKDPRFWATFTAGALAAGNRDKAEKGAERLARLSLGNEAFRSWHHEGSAYSWYSDDAETVALVLETLQALGTEGEYARHFEPGLRWLTFGEGVRNYRSTKARAVAAAVAAKYLEGRGPAPTREDSRVRVEAGKVQTGVAPADPRARRTRVHVEAPELAAAKGVIGLTLESGPEAFARIDVTRFRTGPFKPEDRGFALRSRLETAGDPHPSHRKLTRIVELRVPEDRSYVVVEVPLLAGGEVQTKGPDRPRLMVKDHRGAWQPTWRRCDVLDDRVVLYFDWLAAGEYRVEVPMTPEVAGFLNVLPARAFLMYYPHVDGSSESHRVAIGRAAE